jgi:hypothetical protein
VTSRTTGVAVDVGGAPDEEGPPTASGKALLAALSKVEGLLLRWQDAEVRARWLEARFPVPPDADARVEGGGAPLHVLVDFLDASSDYAVRLEPPVLLVGREGWSPPAPRASRR